MSTDARLAEAVEEYLAAVEAGKAPDRDAFLASHADLADALRKILLGLDFVRHGTTTVADRDEGVPPETLGDYRLLREVGRGGMAVVYEAEQVSLGRKVALKVLPFAAVLDPKQLQRFKNEALAAAHLQHPHIVPVHGVGCERGVHYYAMQYVEGQSLAAAIGDMKGGGAGEGRTPISSHGSNREPAYIKMAAALGVQAAEALDHAHELGIVHRDVKPGNLLVDQAGKLWITDFGLARSLSDVGLTVTGELLGTVRYMSPEQALAKRVPVDHRTDVYSLGATLYELFTLEPAFPGDDPHRVIQEIALTEPLPPRRINPALPRDIETVVLKAMAKEPAHRYATAAEMADDLRRHLEDRPVLARRPSAAARVGKWLRRHRGLAAAALVVLVVGALALAAGAKREERNTREALGRAERSLSVARRSVDSFLVAAGIADLKDRPLPPPERRALLESALEFHATYPDDENSLWKCALIFHELHRYAEALAIYDRVLSTSPRHVEWTVQRGHILWHLQRHDAALAALDRATAIDPCDAAAHDYRGAILFSLGRFEDALDAHDRAVALAPDVARYHVSRAGVLNHGLGRPQEALDAGDRAVAIRPNSDTAHATRGDALYSLGRFAEALAAHERSLAFNPESVVAHTGRGNALHAVGRAAESLSAYDDALRFDPDYVWAHVGRGNALWALGRLEEAVEAHRKALRLRPGFPEAYSNLGVALFEMNRLDEATDAFREAIRIRQDYPAAHRGLGLTLVRRGCAQDGLSSLRKADSLGSKRPGWVPLPAELLESAERQAAAEARLDLVLSGTAQSRDAAERVVFATTLYGRARHAEAARMWSDAFAEDAALAEDLGQHHRYNAACSAALAAAPLGDDAPAWRARALEWLRADFAAREKAGLAATLANWKRDPDFAAVRDRLPELPAAEREEWTKLWADVDAALARAGG